VTVKVGAGANPTAQTFDDNSVVYPRVATDTDAVAAATARGAELFTVLRSADSPEQEQLSVDVPAGGRLLADASGGAHVEAADGTTVVAISAPRAQDAVGRDVPVQMTPAADGRSLQIEVPHRGLGFAYPILVDPVVSPWLDGSGNGWWFSGHRDGLERWWVSDGHGSGAAFAPRSTCYTPVSCYATNGLYIYAYGVTRTRPVRTPASRSRSTRRAPRTSRTSDSSTPTSIAEATPLRRRSLRRASWT